MKSGLVVVLSVLALVLAACSGSGSSAAPASPAAERRRVGTGVGRVRRGAHHPGRRIPQGRPRAGEDGL